MPKPPFSGDDLHAQAYAAAHEASDILEKRFEFITQEQSIRLTNLARNLSCAATEIQSREAGNKPKAITA